MIWGRRLPQRLEEFDWIEMSSLSRRRLAAVASQVKYRVTFLHDLANMASVAPLVVVHDRLAPTANGRLSGLAGKSESDLEF